jgi:hypothetical protein
MVKRADDVAWARGAKMKRFAMINSLVGEIAEALLELGGAAHRNAVVDRLAKRRGGFAASEGLRAEVLMAFNLHREAAEAAGKTSILCLPFGENSHRWELTADAQAYLYNTLGRHHAG